MVDLPGSDEVDEPCEDLCRAIADLQERQAGEDHDNDEGEEWDTGLGAVSEESGCAAFESQTVERTGGAVCVGVSGGEDGGDEESVDKVWQPIDTEVVHSNDIWRSRSSTAATEVSRDDSDEHRISVGNDDTASEGTSNEEDGEASVHGLERALDVDSWPLRLGSDHGNVLWTDDSEGGRPETCKEALEASKCASSSVLSEGVWRSPVAEAIGVVVWVTTDHRDESKGEEQEDQDNLSARQPELSLSVSLDSKAVEKAVEDDTGDRNSPRWDVR